MSENKEWIKAAALFGTIVTDLVGSTAAGLGVGWLITQKMGAPGWLLIITTMSGFSLGIYHVYQLSRR